MTKIKFVLIASVFLCFFSCSDDSNSTGPGEASLNPGEGTLTVSGDIQAEHEGISQYVGLRNNDGNFINLALHVNQLGLATEQESDFDFAIRLVGSEGPFSLETGDYQIGESSNVGMFGTYTNRVASGNTIIYGSSPNSSGTVAIVSMTSTSIEVIFDVNLHLTEEEGSVNITGAFNAECLTADAGFGC